MSTTKTRVPRVTQRRRVLPSMIGRILVGTAGEEASRGAVRMAHAIATLHDASVHVVAAAEPIPIAAMSALDVVPAPAMDEDNRLEVLGATRRQLSRSAPDWPIRAVVGPASDAIVDEARRVGASLVVIGLGHHSRVDRLLGHETAISVVRRAHAPVLIVPRAASRLPSHAVIGIDFTEASMTVARLAAALLPGRGRLSLVHIPPFADFERRDGVNWVDVYTTGAETRLAAMQRELRALTRHAVGVAILHGDPAEALLTFAKRQRCDLIAVGVHSQTAVERMLIGSTTTRVLRGTTCSVLVAPPRRTGAH